MATRQKLDTRPLSALAADILRDPAARAAWIEVAAARMAARLMRDARERSGLSQAQVARALGVSQARISQVESGRVEDIPPLEFLMRYVDACGAVLRMTAVARDAVPAESSPAQAAAVQVLSQDEIDALLGIVEPEAEAAQAVPTVRRDYAE